MSMIFWGGWLFDWEIFFGSGDYLKYFSCEEIFCGVSEEIFCGVRLLEYRVVNFKFRCCGS